MHGHVFRETKEHGIRVMWGIVKSTTRSLSLAQNIHSPVQEDAGDSCGLSGSVGSAVSHKKARRAF